MCTASFGISCCIVPPRSYRLRSKEHLFLCNGVDQVPELRSNCFRLEFGIPGSPIFRAVERNGFENRSFVGLSFSWKAEKVFLWASSQFIS